MLTNALFWPRSPAKVYSLACERPEGASEKNWRFTILYYYSCAPVDQFARFHQKRVLTNALFWPRSPAKVYSFACERPEGASEKNWSFDGSPSYCPCALIDQFARFHALTNALSWPRSPAKVYSFACERPKGASEKHLSVDGSPSYCRCALMDKFARFHQKHALTNA